MSCSCSCGAIMREGGEGRSEGVRKCLLTTVKEDYILLGQKPPLNCLKHKSFVKTFANKKLCKNFRNNMLAGVQHVEHL